MIMPILFRKKSSEVERLTGRQVGRWVYSSANLCSLQCLKQVGDKETTIWSWGGGGGGQIWSGQIIFFHHRLGQKIYFRVNRGQNFYFHTQQIFEKANQKLGVSARVK